MNDNKIKQISTTFNETNDNIKKCIEITAQRLNISTNDIIKVLLPKCISKSKLSLKDYQVDLVNYFNEIKGGLIAAWQVGSGKTLLAVTASQCYLDQNPKGKIIVVTPTSLQANFKKEIKAYGANPNDKKYEFLTLQTFAKKYSKEKCPSNALLIIDEAHNLRTNIMLTEKKNEYKIIDSESIIRSDIAIKCAKTANKILLLTATIVYNNPTDIINLTSLVKKENALSFDQFEELLSDSDRFYNYFLNTVSFYTPQRDENYPSFTDYIIPIKMTEEYYRVYFDIQQKMKKKRTKKDTEKKLGAFLLGIRQASNMLESCPKCNWVLNKIKEGGKTLIYSAFLDKGINRIKTLLTTNNIEFVEITGKLTKAKREEAVKKYNSNKIKVMFITKAGGEGLDLKETQNVIIFESSWNKPNEDQVIGRAIRYKSHTNLPKEKQHVNVYRLIMIKPDKLFDNDDMKKSADELLQDLMRNKERWNKGFLDMLKPLSIENSHLNEERRRLFDIEWEKNHKFVLLEFNIYMEKISRFL